MPERIWLPTADEDGRYPMVDRVSAPGAWHKAVWDPRRSVITQFNDGALVRAACSMSCASPE